jgi:phage gpG-like protein
VIAFGITVRDLGLRRKAERALRLFQDLTPEMQNVGKFVINEGRANLKARGSRISNGRLAKSLQAAAYKRSVTIGSVLPYARIQQEGGVVRPRKRKRLAIPLQLDLAKKHVWPKHVKPENIFRVGNILYLIRRKRKAAAARPKTAAGKTTKRVLAGAQKLAKRSRKGWRAVKKLKVVKRVTKAAKKQFGIKRTSARGQKKQVQTMEVVPGWVLVKSATIPARPYLKKSAKLIQYMRTLFVKKLDDFERRVG